jgi:alkylhydroperoxidase family enzyme
MPRISKHPRIAPLEPPYDDAQRAVLDPLGPPIALFRVLARRPDLAIAVGGWGRYYLSRQSALSLRQRELVIDRVSARCGADYEWGVHVAVFADKVGLTEQQLRSLATGTARDDCWTDPADRAVLAAVDQLHDTHDLDDPTWAALVDAVAEDGALDVLLVAGWYHAIAYAVRALRLPMELGAPRLDQ